MEPTFAILPRCVPGQAEEGREEDNRGGHSSISEPHLISAKPLPRLSVGDPGAACLPPTLPPSVPPSSSSSFPSSGCRGGLRRRTAEASKCPHKAGAACVRREKKTGLGGTVKPRFCGSGVPLVVVSGQSWSCSPCVRPHGARSRVDSLPWQDRLTWSSR